MRIESGAIFCSNLIGGSDREAPLEMSECALNIGQIIDVIYIDNPRNISKVAVEYNILITENNQSTLIYKNCRTIDSFGDPINFGETILNPSTVKTDKTGSPDIKDQYVYKNGSMVIVGFINNFKESGVILAGLQHLYTNTTKMTTNVTPIDSESVSIDDRLKELPVIMAGSRAPRGSRTSTIVSQSSVPSIASLIGSFNSLNSSISLSLPALSLKPPSVFVPPTSLFSLMTRPDAVKAAPTALQSRVDGLTAKSKAISAPSTGAVITTSPTSSTVTENDGQRILGEFNGVRWNINPLGELTIIFQGVKDAAGNIKDTTVQPTIMKINKDGEFFIIDNLDQEIKISRKDWQITISDGQQVPNKITIDRLFNRITVESPFDVQVTSPNYEGAHDQATITGQLVKLGGKDASQQVVLGNHFMKLYNDLVAKVNALILAYNLHGTGATAHPPGDGPADADDMTNSQHLSQNVKVDKDFSGKPDPS